jgi:ABC-type polysaccharide/polyol phosphate transport system ATPase subunit
VISSHSAGILRDLCEKAIWLDKGMVTAFGPVDDVLAAYQASLQPK